MNFYKLYEAGAVKRWHTWPTLKDQDLAAHSWGVAMIVDQIHPEASKQLIMAALVHDLPESESGDVPYPFKKLNQDVLAAFEKHDRDFLDRYDINYNLGPLELHVLKWADMFELYLWSLREYKFGNTRMQEVLIVADNALRKLGHPTPNAEKLYERYVR